MNRTFTPRLGPAVLKRLEAYANRFRPALQPPPSSPLGRGLPARADPRGRTQITSPSKASLNPIEPALSWVRLAQTEDTLVHQFTDRSAPGWDFALAQRFG
jgi:hypothetical protein